MIKSILGIVPASNAAQSNTIFFIFLNIILGSTIFVNNILYEVLQGIGSAFIPYGLIKFNASLTQSKIALL